MSTVIKVENLSKRYRLGLKESRKDTLFAQIGHTLTAPVRNFKRLRSMTTFGQEDDSVFWALKNINFEVQQGEVLGIIGHNGAGKSTLLKLLSRITEPTTGSITLKGRVAALLEVGTGFHQDLTGRENIYMNGTILGMTKREIDSKLDEIVAFSGVEKHLDTPVKFYSSGMKVRLGFSVAAHLEPEILIIDEVLAVGDAEFQKKSLGKMKSVAGEGRTVLLVSHNLSHINNLCKRALVLDKGGISFDGTSNSAVRKYLTDQQSHQLSSKYIPAKTFKDSLILESAVMTDSNQKESSLFNADEEIRVQLNIRVTKVNPKTYLYLTIKNTSGDMIIESDSFESSPDAFSSLREGLNIIEIKIPPRVLPTGDYTIYTNFTSSYGLSGFNLHSPGNILKFSVSDYTTPRGKNRNALTSAIISCKYILNEQ